MDGHAEKKVRPLRIQRVELLSTHQMARALRVVLRSLLVVVAAGVSYLYLLVVFSSFPATRQIARNLTAAVIDPLRSAVRQVIDYLPSAVVIVLIAAGISLALRVIRFVFVEIKKGHLQIAGFFPEWADTTYKIARFLMLVFGLVIAFPYLPGASSPAFRGVSVFIGVLLSLGSTAAVGNAVAGMMLTYMRPFALGDRVKIGDTTGDVMEKSLLVTRVRTIKNVDVTIPNSSVLGGHIVNYSAAARTTGLILNTSVTIGYDADWRTVHALLIGAAASTPGILSDPAPFVFQTALDDFYVRYELNATTNRPNEMAALYSGLHASIQDKFNEAGVEIMSPHYAQLRDGNTSTVKKEHLPPSLQTPAFRIKTITDPPA